jgi:hypothetical protein
MLPITRWRSLADSLIARYRSDPWRELIRAARAAAYAGASNAIETSGGTSGGPGTGLRVSVHASPAISVATRRQKLTAPALASWKATS